MATPSLANEEDEEEETEDVDDEVDDEPEEEETEGEDEESSESEDEEEPVEEVDLPEDEDEDGEGGGGSLLGGTTLGISNKVLLGIGVAAIILVILLRNMEAQSTSKQYDGEEQVDEEIEQGSNEQVQRPASQTDKGGSDLAYSEEAQDTAIDSVFG